MVKLIGAASPSSQPVAAEKLGETHKKEGCPTVLN